MDETAIITLVTGGARSEKSRFGQMLLSAPVPLGGNSIAVLSLHKWS